MPKPKQDRIRISLWVSRQGVEQVRKEAARRDLTPSDIYRELFRIGWENYQGDRK